MNTNRPASRAPRDAPFAPARELEQALRRARRFALRRAFVFHPRVVNALPSRRPPRTPRATPWARAPGATPRAREPPRAARAPPRARRTPRRKPARGVFLSPSRSRLRPVFAKKTDSVSVFFAKTPGALRGHRANLYGHAPRRGGRGGVRLHARRRVREQRRVRRQARGTHRAQRLAGPLFEKGTLIIGRTRFRFRSPSRRLQGAQRPKKPPSENLSLIHI